jgi:SulP family sulfate permease
MKNIFGAFADSVILLPLLLLMVTKTGFDGVSLFASAGLLYILAGFRFRVPMSIQPLKSIVIAGVAIGATPAEFRVSGVLLGLVCLVLLNSVAQQWLRCVPKVIVHSIQLGLGVLLILQGIGQVVEFSFLTLMGVLLVSVLVVGVSDKIKIPFLGVIAVGAVVIALFSNTEGPVSSAYLSQAKDLRWELIAALLIPQITLTLANSVVATESVCKAYWGERASRVSISSLLVFIGVGNVLSGIIGGLPFCHGSGGVTAHKRGGADHWVANLIIGGFLLFLAVSQLFLGSRLLLFPKALSGVLLVSVGIFHLLLAEPSWQKSRYDKLILATALLTVLMTKNLLPVLGVTGIIFALPILLKWRFRNASLQ